MEEFQEWLEGLETQTLTDELKDSIINYVSDIMHTEYLKGYAKAGKDAVDYVKNYNFGE